MTKEGTYIITVKTEDFEKLGLKIEELLKPENVTFYRFEVGNYMINKEKEISQLNREVSEYVKGLEDSIELNQQADEIIGKLRTELKHLEKRIAMLVECHKTGKKPSEWLLEGVGDL